MAKRRGMESGSPAGAPRRRARRVALVVLGALAALLVVLLLLLPVLGSALGAGMAERWFARRHHGELAVGDVALSWRGRQVLRDVRLLDPEGRPVASGTAELPPLWTLLRGGGRRVGRVDVRARAELVADAEGVTNLDRALQPREPRAPRPPREERDEDWRERLRELDLEVHLDVERLSWSDPRTRGLGGAIVVRDLQGLLVARPDTPLTVRAHAAVHAPGAEPGSLELDLRLEGLEREEGPPPSGHLVASIESFPTGLIDGLARQEGLLVALLGPTLGLRAEGEGTLEEGTLALRFAADHARLEGAVRASGGVLSGSDPAALRLRMEPPPEALARLFAGRGLAVSREGAPLELRVEALELPVGPFLEPGSGEDALPRALAGLRLSLAGDLGDWNVALPVEGAGPRDVGIRGLELRARVAAREDGARAELDVRGALAGDAAGTLRLHAEASDLAALASAPREAGGLGLELLLDGLPASLIDAFGGGEPMAQRVLGATVDVQARARGGMERGEIELDARSVGAAGEILRARARARLEEGVLTAEEEGALAVRWTPEPERARALFADLAPGDARLEPPRVASAEIRRLRVPLRRLAEAPPEADALALFLEHGALEAAARIEGLVYQDASLAAAGRALEVVSLELTARGAPEAGPRAFAAELAGDLGPHGRLGGRLTVRDAAAAAGDGGALPPVVFDLRLEPLAVELLEAYASSPERPARLRERVGETLRVALTGEAERRAGAPLRAFGSLDVEARDTSARVAFEATLPEPEPGVEAGVRPGSLRLDAEGLRTVWSLTSPDVEPLLREVLGDTVQVRAQSLRAGQGSAVELRMESHALRLVAAGTVAGGMFDLRAAEGLVLTLQPSAELLSALLAERLPAGAVLQPLRSGEALRLEARDLAFPLDPWTGPEGAESLPSAVRRARATLELHLPGLVYAQPSGDAAPARTELRELRADAVLEEGGPLRAQVRGIVAGERSGSIDLTLRMEAPEGLFGEGAGLPRTRVTGVAEGVPTALIDALAAQGGLLPDVLGPAVDARIDGTIGADAEEPLRVDLRTREASLALQSTMSQRVLRAEGDQGLEASLPLSPLFSQRIVGSLVPLLFQVDKPRDQPVGLRVREFVLPLDGDLRQLDATIELDLGTVAYQLLPGLQGVLQLAGAAEGQARTARIEPLVVRIDDGVARYERLPIPVGAETLVFRGSYDLAQSTFDLTADVPIALMGRRVERELDRVRDLLPADTRVPIELKGSWSSPRVGIGRAFLETVVRQAAEGALRRGLGDLLDRKKKD